MASAVVVEAAAVLASVELAAVLAEVEDVFVAAVVDVVVEDGSALVMDCNCTNRLCSSVDNCWNGLAVSEADPVAELDDELVEEDELAVALNGSAPDDADEVAEALLAPELCSAWICRSNH